MNKIENDLGVPNALSGVIADDIALITYRPNLNKITGSVLSTILLQQMMYWSKKTNNSFYKFTSECNHKLYKKGDSWCEELGFSKDEFSTALKKIGYKLGKNKDKNLMNKEDAFIIYYIDNARITHYSVNWIRLNKMLNEIYLVNGDSRFTKENEDSRFTKENEDSRFTSYTENTSENTSEISSTTCSSGSEAKEIIKKETHLLITPYQEKIFSKWDINRMKKAIEIFKEKDGEYFSLLQKIYKDDGNFTNIQNQKTTGFNNFEPRKYDYDSLEKKLLGWDEE